MSDGRTTSSMFRRSAGTSFPSGSYSPPEVVSDEGDNPPSVLFDGGGFQSPSSPARRPVRAPPKAQLRADHDLSGTPRCIPSETLGCRRGHSTRRTGIVLRAGVGRRRPDPPGPRYYLRRHRRAPGPPGGGPDRRLGAHRSSGSRPVLPAQGEPGEDADGQMRLREIPFRGIISSSWAILTRDHSDRMGLGVPISRRCKMRASI